MNRTMIAGGLSALLAVAMMARIRDVAIPARAERADERDRDPPRDLSAMTRQRRRQAERRASAKPRQRKATTR